MPCVHFLYLSQVLGGGGRGHYCGSVSQVRGRREEWWSLERPSCSEGARVPPLVLVCVCLLPTPLIHRETERQADTRIGRR